MLYTEAQNDIKLLKERLAILEKRLAKVQENNDKCGGNVPCNTSIYRSIEESQQIQNNSDVGTSNGPYDGMS